MAGFVSGLARTRLSASLLWMWISSTTTGQIIPPNASKAVMEVLVPLRNQV